MRSVVDNSVSLYNGKDPINSRYCDLFLSSAGPINLDLCHLGRRPQAKMDTKIGTRAVTTSAHDVRALAHSIGCQKHFRANRVARALGATDEFERDPMIVILCYVPEKRRR